MGTEPQIPERLFSQERLQKKKNFWKETAVQTWGQRLLLLLGKD